MHVLAVGFSVTNEQSFVEFSRQRTEGRGLRFSKVGIGGWAPFQLRHVNGYILDQAGHPDHVIYEIATSQLRAQGRPRPDHLATLRALCSGAVRRGARRISFLDLPREDVTEDGDWLWQMHRDFCAEHGLGYASVSLDRDGMLRDVVHPSDLGKQIYTDAFMGLLDTPEIPQPALERLRGYPAPWSCRPAARYATGQPKVGNFSRGGFGQDMVTISSGAAQVFDFGAPTKVAGYTMLLGPTTGALSASAEGFSHQYKGYDAFCYYERPGITMFEPHMMTRLTIRQDPDVPDTELRKGDKNFGPRTGQIGIFLVMAPDIPDMSAKNTQAAPAPAAAPVLPALTGVARERRLVHLHQPRTAGRSLRQAFVDHLAPGRIETFQPADPETVQRMLDRDAWQVFSGSFQALPGRIAAQLLALPVWMTVVRDPAERLVSFLHYARAVPALKAWHARLKPLSLEDGLALLVSEGSTYAQSSQCRGIVWGEDDPTCDGARRVIDRRFRMVCAFEHLDRGFEALKALDLVAPGSALPHVFNSSAPFDAALLATARTLLAGRGAEDAALHRSLVQDGPVLRSTPAEA